MALPLTGNEELVAIPKDSTTYPQDLFNNFTKIQNAIRNNYNLATASASGNFDAGILEVNGTFQLNRVMHRLSATYLPGDAGAGSTNYNDLGAGTGLGFQSASTLTTYHPTEFTGWYAAKEILTTWGARNALDPTKVIFSIPAATRVKDIANGDWPAIYQPVSVHLPKERWVGQTLTIELRVKTDEATAARLYAAWKDSAGGTRTVSEAASSFGSTGGNFINVQHTFSPAADANFLEFGILIESANAHTLEVEYCILTDNSGRLGNGAHPAIERIRGLAARAYVDHEQFQCLTHGVSSSNGYDISDLVQAQLPSQNMFDLSASSPEIWLEGSLYSHDALAVYVAALNGAILHTTNDAVLFAEANRVFETAVGLGVNLAADGEEYGLETTSLMLNYTIGTADIRDVIAHAPFEGYVERVLMYPPLRA